jgi:hypothetical protein
VKTRIRANKNRTKKEVSHGTFFGSLLFLFTSGFLHGLLRLLPHDVPQILLSQEEEILDLVLIVCGIKLRFMGAD